MGRHPADFLVLASGRGMAWQTPRSLLPIPWMAPPCRRGARRRSLGLGRCAPPRSCSPLYSFGASPALDATQPATFTLWLISYTDLPDIAPDHRVDVSLNRFGLGRIEWDGRQAITATFPVSPGVLVAANNVLSLNLPGVGSIVEGVWLDGFALGYARGNVPAGSSVLFTGAGEPRTYILGLTCVTDTHQAILTRWNAGAGLILYNAMKGPSARGRSLAS